ncbi:M1 family metallopeptidase [Xanthomarina gelatinilytica]|uniref:M1 family metallopeptidase n=1 Tax=Xanthomarina gelatinilytica TaxID=1137281 RepID=UPI003AA85C39
MKYLITVILLSVTLNFWAQDDLYMPLEFQKAYHIGTRSYNGQQGKNYWQNSSNYDIEVAIVPGSWKIQGKQTVTYINNSPDSLSQIIIKLYPNHYKKGGVRANQIPIVNLTDGMIITKLKVNNETVNIDESTSVSDLAHAIKEKKTEKKISVDRHSTFLILELIHPIPSKSTTVFTMEWNTEMPPIYVNKIGAYDDKSSFMGYWYPQIAVYDDIDGWDKNEYTGAQECYSDFGDFNVKIKVPKGNYVFATGVLENAQEVFNSSEFLAYKQSKNSAKMVAILDGKSKNEISTQSTWLFKAKNVRDFAFGISNNFKWIASSIKVNDKNLSSNIVYDSKDEHKLKNLLNIQNKSIQFLSNDFPGVAFPYINFTSFIGVPEFDGMEFPMMANNGFSNREISNNLMTFHELSHTYLPHWVGINEVKYSWMEEGWATYFTIKFCQNLYQDTEFENYELKRTIRSYNKSAGQQGETPLFSPSNYMVIRNMHFQQSYRKPAFLYLALENLLGEALFKTCLKEYITRWAGNHPTPYDFMYTFNDVSGQNLNWFWKKWVFEYGYADVAINKMENSKAVIENIGRLPVPVTIKVTYKNGKVKTLVKTPSIWKNNTTKAYIDIPNSEDLESISLVSDMFPDVDKSNNLLKIKSN